MGKSSITTIRTTKSLLEEIDSALHVLVGASYGTQPDVVVKGDTGSLLEQCLDLCNKVDTLEPEPIRTIHHFACTGGTLISKCLSVMPNSQLLSEVDPLSTLGMQEGTPKFAPTDLVTQMRQSTAGVDDDLIIDMFIKNLEIIYSSAKAKGQKLILRDHAHSHYCVSDDVLNRSSFRKLILQHYPTRSAVLVRDPLDSYLSLLSNHWVHFIPANFDEYCRRYLVFLEDYHGVPIIRYEDFVTSPNQIMNGLCGMLDLPYIDDFGDLFDVIKLCGDSGRKSGTIEPRERRPVSNKLEEDASGSKHYTRLREILGYYVSL